MSAASAVALLLLLCGFAVIPSHQSGFAGCAGDFAINGNMCAKFKFLDKATKQKMSPDELCINPSNGSTFYDISELPPVHDLDPRLVRVGSMITNVFEGGRPNFGYAACEDIGDKRGFTCGYVGFTTGTNDAESIVQEYSKIRSNDNELDKYLARLHELSQHPHCDRESRSSTRGLEGFCRSWRLEACRSDEKFAELQRKWTKQYYMIPSARYAAAYDIHSLLGQAIFYDTIVQHGYQYVEPDINLVRILTLTGPRQTGESEPSYLTRFLTTRRQLQCCYPDDVWPASAIRSADLQALVNNFDNYKDLKTPLPLHHFKKDIQGSEDIGIDRRHCTISSDDDSEQKARPRSSDSDGKQRDQQSSGASKMTIPFFYRLMLQ